MWMRLARGVEEIIGFEMLSIMRKTKQELEGELLENVGGYADDEDGEEEDDDDSDEEDESESEDGGDGRSNDEHPDSDDGDDHGDCEDDLNTMGFAGLGEEVFNDDGEIDEKMFMNLRAVKFL